MGQSLSNGLIPQNYKELECLGGGTFGVVVKCKNKDTEEIVALKMSKGCNMDGELALNTFFKRNNLDKWNIVRFIGPVTLTNNHTALAFETLDITLHDYVFNFNHRLNACDVRSVVQQMASALHALESVKVIHADINLKNIMLVDRKEQPFRLKLIDFGLALPSSAAKPNLFRQMKLYRAPEIFMGLPFSESIDMWSLGVVLGRLILGRSIFPGGTDYNVLRNIVDLLGVPPDHLLAAGMFSNRYFVRESCGNWRLKTYEEFWSPRRVPDEVWAYRINYPDSLDTSPMNAVKGADREECLDLLKAMLRMDSTERITPSQVLAHPFITRGDLQPSSDSIPEATGQPPQTPYSTSMEYKNWVGYDSDCHEPAAEEIPPGVILVQPAPPECRLTSVEDNRQGETSRSIHEASAPPPQTPSVSASMEYESCVGYDNDCHEPAAAEIPPGVMLVQPAPPECCLVLVEDNRQSETSRVGYDSDCHEPAAEEIPPGVILVQPAPPECCLALAEDNRQGEMSRPLGLLEELSKNSSVELLAHPSEGPDVQQEDTKSTDTTPVSQKGKKMTRKNPFRRLWAWAKKTFTSSSRSSVDAEA